MVGMLRDLFMMRHTSTSGRLSCLVWAQPSSAVAMCRSKRRDTDFFLSLGFPLKKEPSHCFITLSIFSVLKRNMQRMIRGTYSISFHFNSAQYYLYSTNSHLEQVYAKLLTETPNIPTWPSTTWQCQRKTFRGGTGVQGVYQNRKREKKNSNNQKYNNQYQQ